MNYGAAGLAPAIPIDFKVKNDRTYFVISKEREWRHIAEWLEQRTRGHETAGSNLKLGNLGFYE